MPNAPEHLLRQRRAGTLDDHTLYTVSKNIFQYVGFRVGHFIKS